MLAFPRFDLPFLAWGGLIPLLFVFEDKRPADAVRWGFLCGFLFFAGTLYWFFNLTRWFSYIAALGVTLLFCYLALYFGVFGALTSYFSRKEPLQRLFLLPSAWVALEWVRGHLFTGFDWASLGHSQYKNLFMIQIADITGVYGVSFLVMAVNVALKEMIASRLSRGEGGQNRVMLCLVSVMVLSALVYGKYRLREAGGRYDGTVPVAVIQPNIDQNEKFDKSAGMGADIMRRQLALSEEAAKERPQLMIWPESSHPGFLWEDREHFTELQDFARQAQIPLLFGSILKQEDDYFNAALLLSKEGAVTGVYKKVHLVPFGEYLPLRHVFPFLSALVGIGDFTAGTEWTVFPSGVASPDRMSEGTFSVLICFEDTVPRLSREFVLNGAQLLVNMTNDGWFGDSSAPYMHLQSSVFRTVENRRGLIRAANTGVSCFIDRWGRIGKCVEKVTHGRHQRTAVSGYTIGNADFNNTLTFYTKYGDVFTIFCFGCILWGIVGRKKETNA